MSTKADHATNSQDDEREATELQPYDQPAIRNAASTTTAADNDLDSVRTNRLKRQRPRTILDLIRSFWKRHVSVTVSYDDCRDHLGGLLLLSTRLVFFYPTGFSLFVCSLFTLILYPDIRYS